MTITLRDRAAIEAILELKFDNEELYREAFTHRSYINEHKKHQINHNERLEFLGDAVLELVVTDYLFRNFDNPEGEMTAWRSALVKTESLADVAERLDIGQYLLMSRGEAKSGGRTRMALLANMVEAIIGAIYMDKGYDAAAAFITKHIISQLEQILENGSYIDAKSRFQELAQEKDGVTPHYELLSEEGPDHEKIFTIGVYIGTKLCGKGQGNSKQNAQQAAATEALKSYKPRKR
ncbi:MAG: ribonuclease III [Candidatus Saccharibacteria bacterium]